MIGSVKKAFVLSVKALKLFYLIAAVNIVANVINLQTIPAPVDVEMSLGKSLLVIGLTILFSLVGIFVYSGTLAYVKELIKTGAANLASFIDNAKKYFLRILGVSLIVLLLFLVSGIVLFGIQAAVPQALKPLITALIVIIFIVLGILFLLPGYAVVGSDLKVVESLTKGILVGRKNFFKILGLALLVFLVAIAVMIVASLISGILSFILRPMTNLIAAIVMAIANSAMAVLVNIAFMDFYLQKSEEGVQS